MADVDFAAGKSDDKPGGRPRRGRQARRDLTPESPEERDARRGPRARRAADGLAAGGPWQWGWRRRQRSSRRMGRRMGCLLWLVTLLVVFVVLSLLFGGFQKGSKVGGSGPARPAVTRAAPVAGGPAAG
jgi:hypothetical protein